MDLDELKGILDQEEKNEQINIKEVLLKYLAYWKWIIGSIVICLTIGGIYYLTKTPIFSVNGAILINIDSDTGGDMTKAFSQMSGLGLLSTTSNVENEVEIIKSRDIMLGVVDSLQLHTSYTTKKLLKKINLYKSTPFRVSYPAEKLNTLKGPIKLTIRKLENGQYLVKSVYNKIKNEHTLQSLPGAIKLPDGRIDITHNTQLEQPEEDITVDVLIMKPLTIAMALSKQVSIELVNKQVNVVSLTYNTDNIKQGLDILNTIISLYNDDSVEERNKMLNRTEEFVSNRISLLEKEVKEEELGVQKYKEANQMTDISADAQMIMAQSSHVSSKQIEVETQLNIIDYVEKFIADKNNRGSFIPFIGIQDQGLVTAISEYNRLVIQKETESKKMNSENPSMININAQIEAMYPAIKKSINNVRNSYRITNTDLINEYSKTQSEILTLPRKEREYIELKRQLEIKQQIFQFLLLRKEETSLSKHATMPICRFIETPASDQNIITPKRMIIFGAAFVLGLMIPIVLIFIYGLINTRIYSKDELEKLTTIPILGEIVKYEDNPIVVKANSNTSANELFRLLRANLQFVFGTSKSKKVILVSSSFPGEGKTFISVNLALSLSLSNKKVLLVGADIRKPRLAETLEIPKKEGLTSLLSEEQSNYKLLLQQIPEYPNLDILQGGLIPPNPNELLLDEKIDNLFEEFRKEYDYIIVDTAPIGVVSDTYLLDRVSDLMLFVVRSGVTTKEKLEILTSAHKKKQISSPYIILNDVDYESLEYSYRSKNTHLVYGYGETATLKKK